MLPVSTEVVQGKVGLAVLIIIRLTDSFISCVAWLPHNLPVTVSKGVYRDSIREKAGCSINRKLIMCKVCQKKSLAIGSRSHLRSAATSITL
jgi:hypothetical protein